MMTTSLFRIKKPRLLILTTSEPLTQASLREAHSAGGSCEVTLQLMDLAQSCSGAP